MSDPQLGTVNRDMLAIAMVGVIFALVSVVGCTLNTLV